MTAGLSDREVRRIRRSALAVRHQRLATLATLDDTDLARLDRIDTMLHDGYIEVGHDHERDEQPKLTAAEWEFVAGRTPRRGVRFQRARAELGARLAAVSRAPSGIWLPTNLVQHRPLTRSISSFLLRHDVICVHTMVGSLAGSWSWSNRPGGTYWALGTSGSGEAWQCHDLTYRSAANLNGNPYVIPIENADHGVGFGPWSGRCGDVPAFTRGQVDKLVGLIAWLCIAFDIPATLIPDTRQGRRGIAYHRQGIDPWRVSDGVLWSRSVGKCCPDWRRIGQLANEIIPRVQEVVGGGGEPPIEQEDDDMPYTVIEVEGDRTRPKIALTTEGAAKVPNDEYYSVGVALDIYKPVRKVTARAYDVAKDLCNRIDPEHADPHLVNVWYAAAGDRGEETPLHKIIRQALRRAS